MWNSSDFGNIATKMDDLKKKLHQFDLLAEQRCLNGGKMVDREKCRHEFWFLEKTNESFWRQKSRNKWIRLGGRNSRFFQICGQNRYRRNFIGTIEYEGIQYDDPMTIK